MILKALYDYYYHNGEENKRYVGKVTFTVEVNNPDSATTDFYLSIGVPADGGSAYIDNISITDALKFTSIQQNLVGDNILSSKTEYKTPNEVISGTIPEIENYNILGYKIGTDGELIKDKSYQFKITADTNIIFVYVKKGDLNDDISVDELDMQLMRKYLLDISDDINKVAALVNSDDIIDIRDLVSMNVIIGG